MNKILVIDDDIMICGLLERFLSKKDYDVKTAFTASTAFALIEQEKFDVVLSDFRLENTDGKEILKKVKEKSPLTPVIIITGYSDVKIAVDVIKHGAFDYITKPFIPDEILLIITKALNKNKELVLSEQNSLLDHPKLNGLNGHAKTEKKPEYNWKDNYITGVSSQSLAVEKQIRLVAPTNYSVIIYGESGTGKESIAQAIHHYSERADKPFVAIDCGALTKELASSELFGHEKGSFTGAQTQKMGQFEAANGGTVFLDEVANLPYDTQVALLRVVQERKMRRIGSTKEIAIDIRIVVASNENLSEAAAKGKFREDLYHRFNEFDIYLSPLRERVKDIELFANYFLKKASTDLNKKIKGFSPEVLEIFKNYSWPGNLREVNNIIKRIVLLTDGEEVNVSSLPHEISFYDKFTFSSDQLNNTAALPENTNKLKSVAHSAECEKIVEVLKKVKYNKSKAAKILEIDRKTLYNKLKQFKLL
jgi:two-component system response regulator HydG